MISSQYSTSPGGPPGSSEVEKPLRGADGHSGEVGGLSLKKTVWSKGMNIINCGGHKIHGVSLEKLFTQRK